jgi:hypothetical protein
MLDSLHCIFVRLYILFQLILINMFVKFNINLLKIMHKAINIINYFQF